MSRVLLVNPSYDYPLVKKEKFLYYNKIWPPICLANCAAMLEKSGFEVKILDANAERLDADQVSKAASGYEKIFITSSPLDRWQCPHPSINPFLDVVRKVGENNPDAEIFVMGTHGTIRPNEILEMTKAKCVIRGEPEQVVLEICNSKDLKKIGGITFKAGKKTISTPDRKPFDLDALPTPAYHLLPLEKYFYDMLGKNFMLFEGSRGCPFNCVFCLKKTYGSYRKKSSKKLIDEVRLAIEKFGIKTAYFIDLEFTINKKLVADLCDFLIEKKYDFKWCCQGRFDTIDTDLLVRMKQAGCVLMHYGVETGSEKIMKMINKNITFEQIENGMKLTKDAGISTACFFILGFPTETSEDMEKTVKFAIKLNPTYASFHIAIPYPETGLYKMVEGEIGDLFPSAYTGIYSAEELDKFIKNAYRKYYFRPSYVFSRLMEGNYGLLFRQLRLFLGYTS
ncbi:MAG: radical SAM protein [Candidatus Aenigmatarchaeota archaeon]